MAAPKEPTISPDAERKPEPGDHADQGPDHALGQARRVVGGYKLKRLLGRGGMAEVWLGVHETSRGLAALKILRKNAAEAVRDFFARERRTVLKLRHPNIVPIFDVGQDYIAAAYIEGVDLRHRMRSPVPPAEAVAMARAIGSALSTAHAQGVIHCDVKPANILLDRAGTPFLADFGIAWLIQDDDEDDEEGDEEGDGYSDDTEDSDRDEEEGGSKATPSAHRAGTPAYMAPEQAFGHEPTPASDQYSLARTLLALIVGQRLPKRPRQALALLPAELGTPLRDVIARGMALSPAERYDSVSDFVDALREIDLSDRHTVDRRVSVQRNFRRFTWVEKPLRVEQFGESIHRADYSLSTLEEAGLLDPKAVARFRERTGHADFTWSMYAREERLGLLTNPLALARARETVVLLHGLFANREVWKDVAVGIARDNGLAVALTPDLLGFGESPLADGTPVSWSAPDRMVLNTAEWLELIGLGRSPTVMLGHSISASALMCVREADLGPEVNRICVTPALPSQGGWTKVTAVLYRVIALLLGWLPRWLIRPVARFMFRREPSLRRISVSARHDMAESALRLGIPRVASLFRWTERADLAPPAELGSCTVVTTHDDPLVPLSLVQRTIRAAGIPEERRFQLIYGGHFPQLIDDAHPEWGARNVHELVSVIDTVLDMTHAKSSRDAVRSDAKTATVDMPGDGDGNNDDTGNTTATTPVGFRGHTP